MRTHDRLRTAAFLAVGLTAGSALVAFHGGGDDPTRRPGLERYRPEAIAAVGGEEPVPSSNAEVAAVMEVRDLCRSLSQLAGRPGSSEAFLDRALDSDAALHELVAADGARPDISAFTRLALDQVRRAEEQGRPDAVTRFVDAECDPTQDLARPILAGDR